MYQRIVKGTPQKGLNNFRHETQKKKGFLNFIICGSDAVETCQSRPLELPDYCE